MDKEPLTVRRLPVRLNADPTLTITRLFWAGPARAKKVIDRVMQLDEEHAQHLLASTQRDFNHLHIDQNEIFLQHYQQVAERVAMPTDVSEKRRLLMGAYFTLEYAFASAALFNPSMTPAIDQTSAAPGALRFVMSLRGVGEGHISSIVFRRGVVDAAGNVTIEPSGPHHEPLRRIQNRQFTKTTFRRDLAAMGVREDAMETVLGQLGDPFTVQDLRRVLSATHPAVSDLARCDREARHFEWFACCDYDIETSPGRDITEIVLFPICDAESQGMEDMRIVRFTDEDGSVRYYGTYTAFNGQQILPQIVELSQPGIGHVRTLHGRCARNKGMALFPRKIEGRYTMSGRIDGENLYILTSDNVHMWNEAVQVEEPDFPWEFVQIGNCGSPIETEAGWLLLTHGVGPMRRYCIGAMLLDRNDPTRLIGRLEHPLLVPRSDERSGYVPNVVYSCGGLVHNGLLIIPYGLSDAATGFATVPLDDVLAKLC